MVENFDKFCSCDLGSRLRNLTVSRVSLGVTSKACRKTSRASSASASVVALKALFVDICRPAFRGRADSRFLASSSTTSRSYLAARESATDGICVYVEFTVIMSNSCVLGTLLMTHMVDLVRQINPRTKFGRAPPAIKSSKNHSTWTIILMYELGKILRVESRSTSGGTLCVIDSSV